MATTQHTSMADLYERDVLPTLTQNLDRAFPEFGWQRDAQGWRATNQAFTHATLGVRADRVVCHGDAPRGFLIHGQGPVLWTTYINDGHPARGREFIAAVRNLADRAGIDAERLDRPPTAAERKATLLADAFALCQRELASDRGQAARDYLHQRGIPHDRLPDSGLGLMPHPTRLRLELLTNGHADAEIVASGLFADTRWPGRIVGAWRNERSRIVTLWARTIDAHDAERYLYLRGAPRAGTIPYGLSDTLTKRARDTRDCLLLVEGVMDVHILQAHEIGPVAALGGTTVQSHLFEQLADLGIEHITFSFDNEAAGHDATARSIDACVRAARSPNTWVIDPDLLGTAKDPGELVRIHGSAAWQRATAAPICGVTWRALELTGPTTTTDNELAKRAELARADAWLSQLPARLAVEQTTALDLVANTLGYDPTAVQRAFQARHWSRDPSLIAHPSRASGITR
jgi:DNA primase